MALSEDRRDLLDRLVAEDTALGVMQREHGFNYKTVRKYYPQYRTGRDWVVPRGAEKKIQEAKEVIDLMAEERAPGRAIAEVVGVHFNTLKKYRPELFWSPEETAEFARMVQGVDREGRING